MSARRPGGSRRTDGSVARGVRTVRDEPGDRPRNLASAHRLPRPPGGRWSGHHRHRDRVGARLGLALRARAAGSRLRVRDSRTPIVSCVVDPRGGHETEDLDPEEPYQANGRAALVVGGGPAGPETARVLALRGHAVRLVGRGPRDALSLLAGGPGILPDGPVLAVDPIGGPIAIGTAEWLAALGREVAFVTPDLADSNSRLQRVGVRRERRVIVRELRPDAVRPCSRTPGPGRARRSRARSPSNAVTACWRRRSTWPVPARPGPVTASRRIQPWRPVLEGRRSRSPGRARGRAHS